MAARKVTYAPRESVGGDRDPQRWCKLGKHIAIPYQRGKKICQICQIDLIGQIKDGSSN